MKGMRLILFSVFLSLAIAGFGQVYQGIKTPMKYDRLWAERSFNLPEDTFTLGPNDTTRIANRRGEVWISYRDPGCNCPRWKRAGSLLNAINGLSKSGDTVLLGGILNRNTNLDIPSGMKLAIGGLGEFTLFDSLLFFKNGDDYLNTVTNSNTFKRWAVQNRNSGVYAGAGFLFYNDVNSLFQFYKSSSGSEFGAGTAILRNSQGDVHLATSSGKVKLFSGFWNPYGARANVEVTSNSFELRDTLKLYRTALGSTILDSFLTINPITRQVRTVGLGSIIASGVDSTNAFNGLRMDGKSVKLDNGTNPLTEPVVIDGFTNNQPVEVRGQTVNVKSVNNTDFANESSNDSGRVRFLQPTEFFLSSNAFDGNQEIPKNVAAWKLGTISANRQLKFPIWANTGKNPLLLLYNENTSAFTWSVDPTGAPVKESDGTSVTEIEKGFHTLIWSGSAWVRSLGGSGARDTLYIYKVHPDSPNVYYKYGVNGTPAFAFADKSGVDSTTASNGLAMNGKTIGLDDGSNPLENDVYIDGLTNNHTIYIDGKALYILPDEVLNIGDGSGNGDALTRFTTGVSFTPTIEISTDFTISTGDIVIRLDTITANRTLTFHYPPNTVVGQLVYVYNSNNSSFSWNVSGAPVQDVQGNSITTIERGLLMFIWDGVRWVRQGNIVSEASQWDEYENFVSGNIAGKWGNSVTAGASVVVAGNFPDSLAFGMLRLRHGTTVGNYGYLFAQEGITNNSVYTNIIEFDNLYFEGINSGADSLQFFIGFLDNWGTNNRPTDGPHFWYSSASNNWRCVTANNGAYTETVTSVPVSAATSYKMRVEANRFEAKFFINGTLVATHTTNINTGTARASGFGVGVQKRGGTNERTIWVETMKIKRVRL